MGDAQKKEKRDYNPASAMAMFIASALQHPSPQCNSLKPRMSTIRVDQYKNKFGYVVVYCTLADDNEVNDNWAENGNQGLPDDDFRRKCIDSDAIVYRRAYEYMRFLAPNYEILLTSRADYPYLLFEDVARLDKFIDEINENWLACLLKTWHAASKEELRERLKKIYKHTY